MISERATVDPRQREAAPIVSWRPTDWKRVFSRVALWLAIGVSSWLMLR